MRALLGKISAAALFVIASLSFAAQSSLAEEISLLPPSAYDRSSIYVNLALFWIALVVLIVLIRLKLREIERSQALSSGHDDEKVARLE